MNLFTSNHGLPPRQRLEFQRVTVQQTKVHLRLSWGSVHDSLFKYWTGRPDLKIFSLSLLCVCIEGRSLRSASGHRTSGIINTGTHSGYKFRLRPEEAAIRQPEELWSQMSLFLTLFVVCLTEYAENARLSLQLSELANPAPLPISECCPPGSKEGEHTRFAREEAGGQFGGRDRHSGTLGIQ